ncbi:hypothetical protein [Haloarchaeobius sp. DFWS5]|uniref:hypothetical protein n=1 Tax=Haloarchaeobius sp. DFWS5 TaxID=3446114 RepID=UPI003EC0A3DF
MRRRQFGLVLAGALVTSLAGCAELESKLAGNAETSTGGVALTPDDDDTPRSVLPKPTASIELTALRRVGQTVGANAGQLATYETGDGTQYEVGVFRMETEAAAKRLAERIAEQGQFYAFDSLVRQGVFLIGGGTETGSADRLVSLLVRSDALSRAYLTDHDLFADG